MIAIWTKAIATALLLFWSCAVILVDRFGDKALDLFWVNSMIATFVISIIAIWTTV